jgi:Transposase family tnp2
MYGVLQYVVQLCLMREHTGLSQRDLKLLSDFPVDPRTAEKEYSLNAKATIYAICPNENCHASYKPTLNDGSPVPIYPSFCTHSHFGRRCKEPLVRPRLISGHVVSVPIKTFVAFDIKDWIGRLLAQAGLEAKMDAAWTACNSVGDEIRDIFDGDMLRNFKGPDGLHFSHGNGEGRYVFSLSLDFFNPLGNKQAGKKKSVGVISLVCLNLPPELRYKVEYMFLAGIIPGRHEPPLDKGNHYIRPIVDSFVELWSPGVWFTRTDNHLHGRLVLCAIVSVVCDLLAAKKVVGFGSLAHTHFCHICHCTRNVHGYGHLEQHLWQMRTNEDTRASAQAYKDSTTEVESNAIFAETGVRWSELLRLPYFDPTRFVVIDAMHNLFLGLINKHFQDILGIRLEKDLDQDAPAVIDLAFSDQWTRLDNEDRKHVSRLIKYLSQPLNHDLKTEIGMALWLKKFSSLRLSVLELACSELLHRGCEPIRTDTRKTSRLTRADYARGILAWVRLFFCFTTYMCLPTCP